MSYERIANARAAHHGHKHVINEPHVHVDPLSPLFWSYVASVVLLVILGGLFSGLTLGLMGLDSVR